MGSENSDTEMQVRERTAPNVRQNTATYSEHLCPYEGCRRIPKASREVREGREQDAAQPSVRGRR